MNLIVLIIAFVGNDKKDSNEEKNIDKVIMGMLLIFLIITMFSGTVVGVQQAEAIGYDVPPEWFQTFDFLNTVPQGSVVTAWRDYGHWMNYFNGDNIHTSLDNIQDRKDVIYTVAASFTHTPNCEINYESLELTCDTLYMEAKLASLGFLIPTNEDSWSF